MDHKRRKVERARYEEMQKPVYVLGHLYEDISSDEEDRSEPVNQLRLHRQLDSVCDIRTVISENTEEAEDTRHVIISENAESDDDSAEETGYQTDVNNNCTVTKTTICLVMNRSVRRDPCGTEEISRDSQIVYSEDIDPKDIDFAAVATDILDEVPKHFNDEHVNVRLVKGDL
ncbi:uncharacterized protein LOC133178874 [Saccostrea echinata]|uniref:uncharacterized protein LOC133178874 n=1 Tax=Saccostrea echinata TaxID=191078 RepID=UPI002A82E1D9|nr:uncharacterized protein LOC133178874 [Saccostrea echinata]